MISEDCPRLQMAFKLKLQLLNFGMPLLFLFSWVYDFGNDCIAEMEPRVSKPTILRLLSPSVSGAHGL